MSNSTFNFFHTPGRNISKNQLNNQGTNSIAMFNPIKTSSSVNFPSKSFTTVGAKPKGLSIRSQSDLNIARAAKSASSIKPDETKKSLVTPHEDKVSKVIRRKQKQGLSPNSKSPHTIIRSPATVNQIFKKPSTPKVAKKVYLEPEKLAGFYDYEEDFNRVLLTTLALNKEAKELSAAIHKPANVIKPFEDSDPSLTPDIEQDPPTSINEDLALPDVEIPSLSDEDY